MTCSKKDCNGSCSYVQYRWVSFWTGDFDAGQWEYRYRCDKCRMWQ